MNRLLLYIGSALICMLLYNFYTNAGYEYEFDNNVVIVEKDGNKEVVKSAFLSNLLRGLDKAKKRAENSATSDEARQQNFLTVWKGIKSRMVDPEPGTYPVKFYSPAINDIPIINNFNDINIDAVWVDNRHVLYWAGIQKDKDAPNQIGWKAKHLILLDVEKDRIVKEYQNFQVGFRNSVSAGYNPETGQVGMSINPIDQEERQSYRGHFDEEFNLIIDETYTGIRNNSSDNYYNLSKIDARMVNDDPPDGPPKWGEYIFTKRDGSKKYIDLNFHVNNLPSYDRVRDQYFITASTKDQRNKVWYFDDNMNIINEYWIERVSLLYSWPSSFLSTAVKGGFVLPCGRRHTDGVKTDFDGETISEYLCHAKYDSTLVRFLKGRATYEPKVSPNGCRVFGFVDESYSSDFIDRIKGKNFMADICN